VIREVGYHRQNHQQTESPAEPQTSQPDSILPLYLGAIGARRHKCYRFSTFWPTLATKNADAPAFGSLVTTSFSTSFTLPLLRRLRMRPGHRSQALDAASLDCVVHRKDFVRTHSTDSIELRSRLIKEVCDASDTSRRSTHTHIDTKSALEQLANVIAVTQRSCADCLLTVVVPRPTLPSVFPGSVNEDQLRLESRGRCFIP